MLIAAVRRRLATPRSAPGRWSPGTACALGVVPATGAVAELRWAEVSRGVLVVGAAAQDVTLAGLQVVHAALRRRKPVIVLDPGGDAAIARALGAACLATGTPLLTAGSPAAAGYAVPRGHGGRGPADAGTAAASGLWGRGTGPERQPGDPAATDPAASATISAAWCGSARPRCSRRIPRN